MGCATFWSINVGGAWLFIREEPISITMARQIWRGSIGVTGTRSTYWGNQDVDDLDGNGSVDVLWRNTSSGVVGRLVTGGLYQCVHGFFSKEFLQSGPLRKWTMWRARPMRSGLIGRTGCGLSISSMGLARLGRI